MATDPTASRTFTSVLERDSRGRVIIAIPFDPSDAWGAKARHHVTGTVGDRRLRCTLIGGSPSAQLILGPAWCRDIGVDPGERVRVVLQPEGPQRATLAPDVAAALAAGPAAGEFFDSLATFYRKGYLRWVDATKRRPDERARRIAEMVELLAAGYKQRPS